MHFVNSDARRVFFIHKKLKIMIQIIINKLLFFQNLYDPSGDQDIFHELIYDSLSLQYDLDTLQEISDFPSMVARLADIANDVRDLRKLLRRVPVTVEEQVIVLDISIAKEYRIRSRFEIKFYRALGA